MLWESSLKINSLPFYFYMLLSIIYSLLVIHISTYICVFSKQNLHFEIITHPNCFSKAFIYLSRMCAYFVPETPRVIPLTSFRNRTIYLAFFLLGPTFASDHIFIISNDADPRLSATHVGSGCSGRIRHLPVCIVRLCWWEMNKKKLRAQ